jgi:hypothetical protein
MGSFSAATGMEWKFLGSSIFDGGFMRAKNFIFITLFALTSVFLAAQILETNQYAVWGINDSKIVIPAGGVITEAVLTIIAVSPPNASFYVHLLDNANSGFATGSDADIGDFFDSHGIPLSGAYENGNYVCRFSQNDNLQSPIRTIFPSPTLVTLADSSNVQLSSALLELMDYAGNGKGIGIGIDPGSTAHLNIAGLKMELTIQSCQSVGSSKLTFSYDLNPPAAWWKLDDNANSTAVVDSSGAGLTGTASRNTSLMSVAGVLGGALAFDGTLDYVRVAPNAAINQYGRSSFAVSAWIYPHSRGQGGAARIVCKRSAGYEFYLSSNNILSVYIPHTSTAAQLTSARNAITLNAWQHVAFVYNENGDKAVKLYVNGVLQTGGSKIAGRGTLSDDRQTSLTIGRYSTSAIRQFDGLIDDVRIFGQALTASQVGLLYNQIAMGQQ